MTPRPVDSPLVLRSRLYATCVGLACALLSSACVWGGIGTQADPPKITPAPATTPLRLNDSVRGAVDCSTGECLRRYEISLSRHGQLSVTVDPDLQAGDLVRVILQDPVGNIMGREATDEPGQSIALGGPAQPGNYQLQIQSASGSTSYQLLATLDTSGAAQTTQLEAQVAQMKPPPSRPQVPTAATPITDSAAPTPAGATQGQADQGFASNPKIDFGLYRSFAFASDPQQLLKAQPGAYIGNPFIDAQIERAIRAELAKSDYFLTSPDQAEFLVNFHTGRSSTAYYVLGGIVYNYSYATAFGMWSGYPGYYGGIVRTDIHTEGTLVIDIIDIKSKQLVWNGWATKTTGWRDNDVVIREAVQEILKNFPPQP